MLCGEGIWRASLKKYFGASSCRKWYQLAVDVQCVALGLKPAYLLDILQPDPARFCSLLNDVLPAIHSTMSDMHQWRKIEWWDELCVVSVESDVLLVNRTAIQDLFQSSQQLASSCVYVDISNSESSKASRDCTDAHIGVVECFSEIEKKCQIWYSEHVEASSTPPGRDATGTIALKCSSSSLPPDLNMCTVFGRLLGYPVVYWFQPDTGHNLDMVHLVNYHVTVSTCSSEGSYMIKVCTFHLLSSVISCYFAL